MAISSLKTAPGSDDAVTARLIVERKNAIISISKPRLPIALKIITYAHITADRITMLRSEDAVISVPMLSTS